MNVSIIIPVYNEEDYLAACLDAIAAQQEKPFEVIVVDNNSTDGTSRIAKRYPFVRIITEKRQGTVYARNAGFRAAKGEILGRIDADTRIPEDWIGRLQETFTSEPETAAITGSPLLYDTVLPGFFNLGQRLLYQRFQKLLTGTYVLWGANMAIRRKVWHHIAPRCSEQPGIDEDIDLSFWLHKQGFLIHYLPDLKAAASLQRGRTGLGYTIRYLSTWPRDYRLHEMRLRAALIAVFIASGIIISLPFLLYGSLKERFAG